MRQIVQGKDMRETVVSASCTNRQEVCVSPWTPGTVLNVLGDTPRHCWDGEHCCMFSAMFLVACEPHAATHPKEM